MAAASETKSDDSKSYLTVTGTTSLIGTAHATNTIVATALAVPLPTEWTLEQLTELYSFLVPPLGPDGTCR